MSEQASFTDRVRGGLAGLGDAFRAHSVIGSLLALGVILVALALVRGRDPWRAWANERAETRIVRLTEDIHAAAARFERDPYLVAAVVFAESSGRPWVESSAGAVGLMQLKLETAIEQAELLGVRPPRTKQDLEDPATNLLLGVGYLDRLIDRFDGDTRQGLMAYNTGPTRFAEWIREAGGFQPWLAKAQRENGPPKPGTVRHYATKIADAAERFRSEGLLESS